MKASLGEVPSSIYIPPKVQQGTLIVGFLMVQVGLLGVILDFRFLSLLLLPVGLLFILVFCMEKPRGALLFYIVTLYFVTFIGDDRVRECGIGQFFTFVPELVKYLPEVILIGLLITTLGIRILVKQSRKATVYDLLIFLLFLVGGLSWYANSVPFFTTVAALRLLVSMVIAYFVLRYSNYSIEFFESVFNALFIISIVQFPITLFQRFIGVEILHWPSDMVAGTFPRYTGLIFFQLVFFIIGIVAYSQKTLPAGFRNRMVWGAIFALGSISLSNSRAAFFMVSILLLIFFGRLFIRNPVLAVKAGLFTILLFGFSMWIFIGLYGGLGGIGGQRLISKYINNPVYAIEYLFRRPGFGPIKGTPVGRGGAIVYMFERLQKDPYQLLLGLGPGMTSEFKYSVAVTVQDRVLMKLGVNRNQISSFLGELGLLGLSISLLLPIVGMLVLKGGIYSRLSPHSVVLRKAYPLIILIFLLMQFYGRVWYESHSAFLFWFVAVYLLRVQEEAQANIAQRPING